MKKVSIIGVGKVGISLCAALLNSKFSVFISDKDKNLISKYKKKKFPFYEPGIKKIIIQNFNKLTFSDDSKELIKKTDTTFIVVPTNSNIYGGFSNKYILQVFDNIKEELIKKKKISYICTCKYSSTWIIITSNYSLH